MPNTDDNIEARVTRLEGAVERLGEEVTIARSDALAARALASATDRDVATFGAKLDSHTKVLNALRETQLEQGDTLRQHGAILRDLSEILRDHSEILRDHSEILRDHGAILRDHSEILRDHGERLVRVEEKVDRLEGRFNQLEGHVDRLEGHVDRLGTEMRSGFATVGAGMARITTLLERVAGPAEE